MYSDCTTRHRCGSGSRKGRGSSRLSCTLPLSDSARARIHHSLDCAALKRQHPGGRLGGFVAWQNVTTSCERGRCPNVVRNARDDGNRGWGHACTVGESMRSGGREREGTPPAPRGDGTSAQSPLPPAWRQRFLMHNIYACDRRNGDISGCLKHGQCVDVERPRLVRGCPWQSSYRVGVRTGRRQTRDMAERNCMRRLGNGLVLSLCRRSAPLCDKPRAHLAGDASNSRHVCATCAGLHGDGEWLRNYEAVAFDVLPVCGGCKCPVPQLAEVRVLFVGWGLGSLIAAARILG